MGAAGNDDLRGENENDVLIGGLGADQLTGGSDRDSFVFTAPTESGIAGNSDVILDFSKIESDRIDLSLIDAKLDTLKDDAFIWKGAAAFQEPGELRYFYDTPNNVTVLEANMDNNLSVDFQIRLAGNISLEAKDFIL